MENNKISLKSVLCGAGVAFLVALTFLCILMLWGVTARADNETLNVDTYSYDATIPYSDTGFFNFNNGITFYGVVDSAPAVNPTLYTENFTSAIYYELESGIPIYYENGNDGRIYGGVYTILFEFSSSLDNDFFIIDDADCYYSFYPSNTLLSSNIMKTCLENGDVYCPNLENELTVSGDFNYGIRNNGHIVDYDYKFLYLTILNDEYQNLQDQSIYICSSYCFNYNTDLENSISWTDYYYNLFYNDGYYLFANYYTPLLPFKNVYFGRYDIGYSYGNIYGYDDGYTEGYEDGYFNGQRLGYEQGYSAGYNAGYDAGYNVGFSDAGSYDFSTLFGYDNINTLNMIYSNDIESITSFTTPGVTVRNLKLIEYGDTTPQAENIGLSGVELMFSKYGFNYNVDLGSYTLEGGQTYKYNVYSYLQRNLTNFAPFRITTEIGYINYINILSDSIINMGYTRNLEKVEFYKNDTLVYTCFPTTEGVSYTYLKINQGFEFNNVKIYVSELQVMFGYDNAFYVGMSDITTIYNNGYDAGFRKGLASNTSYSSGYDAGYNVGYNNGYNAGASTTNTDITMDVASIFDTILTAPLTWFTTIFGFELFGINLAALSFGIIGALLLAYIIKKFL